MPSGVLQLQQNLADELQRANHAHAVGVAGLHAVADVEQPVGIQLGEPGADQRIGTGAEQKVVAQHSLHVVRAIAPGGVDVAGRPIPDLEFALGAAEVHALGVGHAQSHDVATAPVRNPLAYAAALLVRLATQLVDEGLQAQLGVADDNVVHPLVDLGGEPVVVTLHGHDAVERDQSANAAIDRRHRFAQRFEQVRVDLARLEHAAQLRPGAQRVTAADLALTDLGAGGELAAEAIEESHQAALW